MTTLSTAATPARRAPWTSPVLAAAAAVMVTYVAVGQPPMRVALLVAAAVGGAAVLISARRPALPVWLMLLLLFFGNRIELPALYFWGRYLPTAGLGLFMVAVVVRQLALGRLLWRGRRVLVWFAAFALVLIVSAAYNGSTFRDFVLSAVTNLRYPLFYTALLTAGFSVAFYVRVLRFFIVCTLIQLPVAIVQFALGIKGDVLAGTLGTNGGLIAVTLVNQCVLIALWVGMPTTPARPIVGITLMFIPLVLGDVQASMLFLPLLASWILLKRFGAARLYSVLRRVARGVALLLVVVLMALASSAAVRDFLGHFPEHFENVRRWNDPPTVSFSSVGRVTVLLVSLPLLAQDPVRLVWGFGPESASGGLIGARQFDSAHQAHVAMEARGEVCQVLLAGGVLCRESQSFRSVMEFGLLGTALYIVPLVLVWRDARRLRRRHDRGPGLVMALLMEGVAVLYIVLGFWYAGVWRLDSFSLPFWLTAAATRTWLEKGPPAGALDVSAEDGLRDPEPAALRAPEAGTAPAG